MSHEATRSIPTSLVHGNLEAVPLASIDAILVLGGGVPRSLQEPPVYVQQRCDDAAALRKRASTDIPILTLSAGTAHLSQLLSPQGLPIWESTSSAAYLKSIHGIESNVYVETTSYDTIGNAFFARTGFTQVTGWRKLLIITNQFHMDRTKAIFEWIFQLNDDSESYELHFYSSPDVGLGQDALDARRKHEERSARTVREKLMPKYRTMKEVWSFINDNHDLYTASKLVLGATQVDDVRDEKLKASYGGK